MLPFCARGCTKCTDARVPPGGAVVQPHSYIIFCVAMAMKPATHTPHPWQSRGRERAETRGPSFATPLSAICHLDSRGAEVTYEMPERRRERETENKNTGE